MPAISPVPLATETHNSRCESGVSRPQVSVQRCVGADVHERTTSFAPGSSAVAARQRSPMLALIAPLAIGSKR